jgi:hypothetical protein
MTDSLFKRVGSVLKTYVDTATTTLQTQLTTATTNLQTQITAGDNALQASLTTNTNSLQAQINTHATDISTYNTNLTNHIGSTGVSHGVATTSTAGFLSAADKTKLDGLSNDISMAYNIGNVSGATTITVTNGDVQYATSTGNTTWSFTGAGAAGTVTEIVLELTNGGAFTQTWNGVKWDAGTAPSLTASGLDILTFYTRDGGTTWRGFLASKDNK